MILVCIVLEVEKRPIVCFGGIWWTSHTRGHIHFCAFFLTTDLQFKAGNITGVETIDLLEELNTVVFDSSGTNSNAYDPYSCNLNGLSTYINCPFEDTA